MTKSTVSMGFLQVFCSDITKDEIETIMNELLQLYDMEAKCT